MNHKIENNILLFILIRGIFLLFFNKATIIEISISFIISFFLIILYKKINKYFIIKDLLIVMVLVLLSIYTLNCIASFISYNIMKSYPIIIISISFIMLSLYLTIKGYHAYIKTSELSFYIVLLFSILSIIFLSSYIKISNLKQVIYFNNFINIYYIIVFSLMILLIYICLDYLNHSSFNKKIFLFNFIHIIFIKTFIISILSKTLENVFPYPYISIFKKVSFFDFFERIESFFSLQFLFDYFFILTLFLLTIKTIIQKRIKVKKKTLISLNN